MMMCASTMDDLLIRRPGKGRRRLAIATADQQIMPISQITHFAVRRHAHLV
jgi:hypothetical protein